MAIVRKEEFMKKLDIKSALGGGGNGEDVQYESVLGKFAAYTLAEIIIVLVVISVVVACTMRVAKTRLDNITTYTYYSAYNILNDATSQMLADYNPSMSDYTEISLLKKNKLFSILFPSASAGTWGKVYHCAEPVYSSVWYDFNNYLHDDFTAVATIIGPYEVYDSLEDVDCTHRPKWYQATGIAYDGRLAKFEKCDGQINGTDTYRFAIIKQGDPYYGSAGVLLSEPPVSYYRYYTFRCDNICTNGKKKCGSYATPSNEDNRYSCVEGPVIYNNKGWAICEDERYEDCPVQECESGMVWKGEPTCACVAEPPTIPRKGSNFCKLFVSLVNTTAGATCNGSAISSDTTDFSVDSITEDFTLRNGMKVYNVSQDPIRIADLVGNTDVGTVTKADGTQIKTNEWGYVLYIDIDGTSSGDSKLWEDVYPFYVTLSGRVIPAYKTDNASDYNLYGGGSRYYLQTSIQVDTSDASGSRQYWLANSKSISFREAACRSGYVGASTNYCKRGTSIGLNGTCASENSSCTIKKVSPIRVF